MGGHRDLSSQQTPHAPHPAFHCMLSCTTLGVSQRKVEIIGIGGDVLGHIAADAFQNRIMPRLPVRGQTGRWGYDSGKGPFGVIGKFFFSGLNDAQLPEKNWDALRLAFGPSQVFQSQFDGVVARVPTGKLRVVV